MEPCSGLPTQRYRIRRGDRVEYVMQSDYATEEGFIAEGFIHEYGFTGFNASSADAL